MKLTRALKEKNRLIKKIATIKNQIITSNVVLEGNNFSYNMEILQAEYKTLVDILIALKVAIQIANRPIFAKIYTLSEIKATIAMISQLDTKEGQQEPHGYGNTELRTYKAQFSRPQADEVVADLQIEIDTLQDEIDEFNATTTVDFEFSDLII